MPRTKRITTDIFQLALILTLLHNTAFYTDDLYFDLNDITNTTRFENPGLRNDMIITDGIFETTYYSRTSAYHNPNRLNSTVPPHLSAKELEDPPTELIVNQTGNWILDDNTYYRDRIIEELQRLSIRRYSQLPNEVSKASGAFRSVTAYLLNNTNETQTSGFSTTIPELPVNSPVHVEPIPNPSSLTTSNINVQHASGDGQSQDEEFNFEMQDLSFSLLQEIEDVSTSYKDGFLFQDMFHEDRQGDISFLYDLQQQLNEEENIENGETSDGLLETEVDFSNFNLELPEAMDSSSTDAENKTDIVANVESNGFATENSTISYDEGASAIALLDEYISKIADTLQVEQSSFFEQYGENTRLDTDEFSDDDLMLAISPGAIHGDDDDDEHVGSMGSASVLVSTEETKIDRRRGISSSGGSISSHDDLPKSGEVDQVDADGVQSIIEELWETDSGVFDSVLDSPGFLDTETDEEIFSKNRESFLKDTTTKSEEKEDENVSWDEESGGIIEDSLSSEDMLQTAPIHSGVRPTPHPAQPRGFQVHARMTGQMRGSSVDQRFQDLASLLSFPPPHGDPNSPIQPSLPHHHFGAHHHHHHHLNHHPFHHPSLHYTPFGTPGPTNTPYTTESARSALIHNATLPLPPPDLNTTGSYPNIEMGPPPNLGSAVASSMHLTNNSDPLSDPSHYNKLMESSHDMVYYSNASHPNPDLNNQTSEGMLSLINDESLIIDMMTMSEGMYAMRMLDSNVTSQSQNNTGASLGIENSLGGIAGYPLGGSSEDRLEASSDSAVSSMGSERVPPMIDPILSDNDWSETEHQHSSPYSTDYPTAKLRYDYYGKGATSHRIVAPVPQKKHQMFGKRFLHDQGNMPLHPLSLASHSISPYSSGGLHHPSNPPTLDSLDMKYSCGLDFARQDGRMGGSLELTNHTYALPPTHSENPMMSQRANRVPHKDKLPKKEHMSRDEKKARSLGLPLTTDEIINLPMDEFNERLSKHDLSETQLSLIRDIRRRGKNKVAAQNCRKRKIDQINQLENEVNVIRQQKQSLLREHDNLFARKAELSRKYTLLHQHVFQGLRGPDGSSYNPHEWRLLHGIDGNVSLVPVQGRMGNNYAGSESVDGPSSSSRRGNSSKSKEDMKKDGIP